MKDYTMFKKSLLAATLGLGLAGFAQAENPEPWTQASWMQAQQAMPQGDAIKGEKIHKTGLCMTCHGANGIAPTRNTPHLAGQQPIYTYKTLLDYQSKLRAEAAGRSKVMHAAAEPMTKQDMADLAAYYAAQELPSFDDQEVPAQPAAAMTCIGCHGATGEGMANNPAIRGQNKDYLVRTLQDFKANKRANDIGGTMSMFASSLSDEAIEEIAEYYHYLK